MSKLAYGLNITKKGPTKASRPPPARRKAIFDDEDSDLDEQPPEKENAESIEMIRSLQSHTGETLSKADKCLNPNKSKAAQRPPNISQYGDLATKHSTSKHSKGAQDIDSSIYEYDEVYDSLHAKPSSKLSSGPYPSGADQAKKPKYMAQLLAASEVRKRDQVRAKEKMLAREREAEGDEFADKEQFVTAAYKRQQEEMRKAEEEEAERERQAEERRKREGGGMKGLYKSMLEQDEVRHQQTMKQMDDLKKSGNAKVSAPEDKEMKNEKNEKDLAQEKGAVLNEEGEVVDKRQLLNAGLNAASGPRPKVTNSRSAGQSPNSLRSPLSSSNNRSSMSAREKETRAFEERLLGKRSAYMDEDSGDDARAAKSRKMEDEILAMIGK